MNSTNPRSFFSNSLNIFIIRFLATFANLMIVIYYSHQISRADYGRYTAFWVQLMIGVTVASCGFSLIAFTYKPKQLLQVLAKIAIKWRIGYIGFILLCSVIFTTSLQTNGAFNFNGLKLVIPTLFFIVYSISFQLETLLIVFGRVKVLLIINLIYPLLFFGVHVYAASQDIFSMERLISMLLILMLMRFMLLALYSSKAIKQTKQSEEVAEALSISSVKKLWLHLGIYDAAQIIFRQFDKLIISIIASKEALAIYYNGSQDVPFLPIFLASVRSASLIQMSASKGDSDTAVDISNKASAVLSTVAFATMAFLLCFRNEVITAIFSEKYVAAIPVFICSLLIIPAQFCCPVFFILQSRQKGAIINKGAIMDMILAIALMIPFYHYWGAIGITLAIVAAAYVQTGYYVFHAARTINVPIITLIPWVKWLKKIALYFGLNYVLYLLLHTYSNDLMALIVAGAATGSIAILSIRKEFASIREKSVEK